MYSIIDFHSHIYPDKIAVKAANAISEFYGISTDNDGATDNLVNQGKACGIGHFVVHSVATVPHQTDVINNFIAQTVGKYDCMTGFGTVHPDGNVAKDVETIVGLGLKGIKIHPDFQKFRLDETKSLKIFEEARKHSLPVLIHTGDKRYNYSNPDQFIPVLNKFPDVQIVGAHFGGWSMWEEATERLHSFENLIVDCSSSFYALSPEKATELIRIYGADRVLFGCDFPLWHPKSEIDYFMKLDLTEDEKKKILCENAKKLLNL